MNTLEKMIGTAAVVIAVLIAITGTAILLSSPYEPQTRLIMVVMSAFIGIVLSVVTLITAIKVMVDGRW